MPGAPGPRRRALITGGSGGIGLACGRLLVEGGYDVVLCARRPEPLAKAAVEIGARWHAADCADEVAFAEVVAEAGPIDFLVHAAGMMAGTFVRKEEPAMFDRILRTNLRSAYVAAAACLPVMKPGSRLVFLSSSAAHAPQPGRAAYSASKAALGAFASSLALEVERDGIAVHLVTPAPVATAMLDDVHFPMMSLDAEDVAKAVVWLDQLSCSVVLPELRLRSVERGPFAPEPFVPAVARALGRTEPWPAGSQ